VNWSDAPYLLVVFVFLRELRGFRADVRDELRATSAQVTTALTTMVRALVGADAADAARRDVEGTSGVLPPGVARDDGDGLEDDGQVKEGPRNGVHEGLGPEQLGGATGVTKEPRILHVKGYRR
jgi:hypothetical protein